jgi:hypothetical protein
MISASTRGRIFPSSRSFLLTIIARSASGGGGGGGNGSNPAASEFTGIDYALAFNEQGKKQFKKDFVKEYKCFEYLNFNKYTFFDKEVNLRPFGVF